MVIFPPFRGALGETIVTGESVPLEVNFGYSQDINVVGIDLLSDGTIFRMISLLGKAVHVC